jgi:TolB protein
MRALSALLPALSPVLCGCIVIGGSNRTVHNEDHAIAEASTPAGHASTPAGHTSTPAAHESAAPPAASQTTDWREAERGILENHVQLTFSDRFVKAGEAYFSPDERRIIFQAVEVPPPGHEPDEFYAMFVADLVRDAEGGITGIDNIRRISPPGSANTCGWFHPRDPDRVFFGSTIGPPTEAQPPGFNRSTGRYRWAFPPQMRVVTVPLDQADGTADSLDVVAGSGTAYTAEDALNPDGRLMVYCSLQSGQGDLFVKNLLTGQVTPVVQAPGYDGGPFFSPDGRRICYRSDRLQIFVSDLTFDASGMVTGTGHTYQVTDDGNVNWCPFWHPDGRHLVFSTSRLGHSNYEIFLIDADPGDLPGSPGPIRYGTGARRVTYADGSDVLPAFNGDGSLMMWTSRRGSDGSIQLWVADFVMDLDSDRGSDASTHGQN